MPKGLDLSKRSDMRKFKKQLETAATDAFMNTMQTVGIDTTCPLCGATIKATFGKVVCPFCGGEIFFNPPSP